MVWKNNMARRRITSIATWTSAFFVFASIYLAAHPQRVQEILKYGYIVRSAAARYSGWGGRDYDIQFRLRQQLMPQRSWSSIDQELWTLYVASPPQHSFAIKGVASNNAPNRAFQSSSSRNTQANFRQQQMANRNRGAKIGKNTSVTKPGFCFRFNRSIGCQIPNCKFTHKCISCNKDDHGEATCKLKQ